MKRFCLHLFTTLAVTLVVGTVLLWGLSYYLFGSVSFARPSTEFTTWSCQGRIRLSKSTYPVGYLLAFYTDLSKQTQPVWSDTDRFARWRFLGFTYSEEVETRTDPPWVAQSITVPYWFLFLCSAVVAGVLVYRCLTVHRRISGQLCLKCGYDVRASDGQCPECSAVIPALGNQLPKAHI